MESFERFNTPRVSVDRREATVRILELGRELYESEQVCKWPGLKPSAYQSLKKDEEEFPGFVTPIDELIERFEAEGMTFIIDPSGKNQEVFVVPAGSDNVQMESLLPRHLQTQITAYMDGSLAEMMTILSASEH